MPGVVLHDFRHAVRQLLKSKAFTITAIVALALGIGANTAIFTLVNAVMLKSLPVVDPQRLIRLGDTGNCCVVGGYQGRFSIFSYPLYTYLRDHTPEFDEMAAFQAGLSKVGVRRAGSQGVSEPFVDQFVSGNYFSMFGLRPFAGRLLSPADDVRGAAPVAVMSYRAWREHYSGDASIVGSTFIIDGAALTIAGVAPPGFFGDTLRPDPPDFWIPLADEPYVHRQGTLLEHPGDHWLYIIGRAKPGQQIARIESEVNLEFQQWFQANLPPPGEASRQALQRAHITLVPAGGGVAVMKENYERDLRLLMAITALVLLIACANLANLQLARGATNLAQTSIRVALGAPRGRLVREMLAESIVLAVAGGAAGLLVAAGLTTLLVRLAFRSAKFVPVEAWPSLPILGFAFLLSLVTGVVFGIAPAWLASRADPASVLRGTGRSAAGRTTLPQKALVVLQAALSLVLLAGAGLMIQTLRHLEDQQFGFRTDGAVVVDVNAAFGGYGPDKLQATYRELERQLRQIPGVRNAALMLYSPMSGNNWQSGVTLEERPARMINPSWDRVSPSFFDTVGAKLVAGRLFDERDTPDSTHVAVINQAFARQILPNENPLGKRFGFGGVAHSADYEIAGVITDIVFRSPRRPAAPMFFLPLLQVRKSEWTNNIRSNVIGNILLHVSANPPDLSAQIHRALAAADPNLTMLAVNPIKEKLGNQMTHERMIARLAELFGGLALLLASIGLYGITAYSVARRTGEIGVRAALGASRGRVVRLILKGALAQVAIGLALGIPAAIAASRVLADQLFGVKSSDPMVLTAAAMVLTACGVGAGIIPALRASSVDPVRALRADG